MIQHTLNDIYCVLCVCIMCVLLRHFSVSSPRLFGRDHNGSVSSGADLSSHRPHSFYSRSSDRLNSWQQPGVTGNVQTSSVDTVGDVDTWQYRSSTDGHDGDTERFADDFRFYSDTQAPTVASSTPPV